MDRQTWTLNEKEYFQTAGLSLLLCHDFYPEGKQGGIELIQHGRRVITNADIRVGLLPGQWAHLPKLVQRQVNTNGPSARIDMDYGEFTYTIKVEPEGERVRLSVDFLTPLPKSLEAQVAFNLEILPSAYWGSTYHLGGKVSVFPRQANGPMVPGSGGELVPLPLAQGKTFTAAPEDPLRWLQVERLDGGELIFYDGRNTTQDNWYVLRAPILPGKDRNAVELTLWANAVAGWRRSPVIQISQVGYHPQQEKKAFIELESDIDPQAEATLYKIEAGGVRPVLAARPESWGRFLRYQYAQFDFTWVKESGTYQIGFEGQTTAPFQIGPQVYQQDVWQPTLETFIPVQMCHMAVRDRFQVWHGACHLDDALQAPLNHEHFDSYCQNDVTETQYQPLAHVPGLNRGGWHDAGDYDLAAGSQAATTHVLSLVRETFGLASDQTTVDQKNRLVTLHQPDGIPDILHQVVHGVENLLSGYRTTGHSFCGIIAGTLEQYTHQGDAATMTDNQVYDPLLANDETEGLRSGKRDDRWVFTNRDTALEYKVSAALAAASRVLRGHKDSLAEECLQTAIQTWTFEQSHPTAAARGAYVPGRPLVQQVLASVELLLATGEEQYMRHLQGSLDVIEAHINELGWAVTRVIDMVVDEEFRTKVTSLLTNYGRELIKDLGSNPYRVPFHPHVWGVGWQIQQHGLRAYYLHRALPEVFDREIVCCALNYVLGCHPASSTSLVSGVGSQSLTVAYGTNRAEFSYIPGGGASGPNLVRPDFPELLEDFPFLWQQAEYVIGGAATYLFCVLAVDQLLNR